MFSMIRIQPAACAGAMSEPWRDEGRFVQNLCSALDSAGVWVKGLIFYPVPMVLNITFTLNPVKPLGPTTSQVCVTNGHFIDWLNGLIYEDHPGQGPGSPTATGSKTMLMRIFPLSAQTCTATATREAVDPSQDARRFVESFAKAK